MYHRNKVISVLVLFFILAGLFSGCASQSMVKDSRTVVVAVVEDDPGEAGNPNPQSAYAGVKLAAGQMQDHWGINIEVVPYADGGNVDTAKEVAGQIAQSGVVAVIGHSSIETSQAAADIYEPAGIPVIFQHDLYHRIGSGVCCKLSAEDQRCRDSQHHLYQ
jgi:basic membrane lipoprotein Med (substrate-binding protein (PBP1-ABC) superfamily)